jgi:hypothetical protein
MKYALAAFLVLLASGAQAQYLTSDDLRRRCSGAEGEQGTTFCDGYLQGQIEAFALRESLGERRRCVSDMSTSQRRALRARLLEWLTPRDVSLMGFPPTASADIDRALSSENFCR